MIGVQDLVLPKRKIAVPLPPSYIKFDGAFGLGAGTKLGDKSRYRSHGTISGAGWAAGLHGYALDFNKATPSYVSIPASHTQLDFTSEDFSIIARVKVDTFATFQSLIDRGEIGVGGWKLYLRTIGAVAFYSFQGVSSAFTSSSVSSLVVGTWYTVGVTRIGAAAYLYINGAEDTDIVGTHPTPASADAVTAIGTLSDLSTQPYDGKIEFLRVFGGIALPASTHLAYHNALA